MVEGALEPWLQRLEALHPTTIDLGLERVAAVAHTLGLLPVAVPVVAIAGTNGKGSTAAVLERLLTGAGRRPGVYTSPHLLRYNERIRVGGVEVEDDPIIEAFEIIEVARGDISLTYFEFGTLAALWLFRHLAADVLVLEVGLGGRLDAVNIVDASVAVITSIGLDHQQWLGGDRDAIGREKAGILRRGRPAIIADADPPPGLLAAAAEIGAQPLLLGRDFYVESAGDRWRPLLWREGAEALRLPELSGGALVPSNVAAALQAFQLLGEDSLAQDLVQAIAGLVLPGRRQHLKVNDRDYLLDVAHNPEAVDKLLEYLRLNPCPGKTIALFSAMEDKDIRAMIRRCAGSFAGWFLGNQPGNTRAAGATAVGDALRAAGEARITQCGDLQEALRGAQRAMTAGDRLVVFGSFHTVAAVMAQLEGNLDGGR